MVKNLINEAKRFMAFVIDIRRKLHEIPELRWEETKTTALILSTLQSIKDESTRVQTNFIEIKEMKGGIIVNIGNDPDKKRILFRADYDGLPIEETTGLDFSSKHPGKMHACGHDVHTAMLLGFFRLVVEGWVIPNCNLRLVFQRAEENPESKSGGDYLVHNEDVLDGISEAYALHIDSMSEAGVFKSRPGIAMANSDRLRVKVTAVGGHVMRPDNGSNALRIAKAISYMLDNLVPTLLDPLEHLVFEPTTFNSGTATNIRPGTAEFSYGVRNFLNADKRKWFKEEILNAIEKTATLYESDSTVLTEYMYGHPSLANSENPYENVDTLLRDAGQTTELQEINFGGEDFAHYLEHHNGVPGCMWLLGAHQKDSGAHHTPTFNPDESVFWKGVLFWLLLATK